VASGPTRHSGPMSSQSASQIEPETRAWPGRVLVGFDGSHSSALAIDWAVREVAARGSSLRIASSASGSACSNRQGVDDLQEQRLSRLLCELHDEHPSLIVELAPPDGDPHHALLETAVDADLLVLAASTNASVEAVLLGSLARKAMRRSPCPVVVVRGSRTGPVRRMVVGVDGSSAAAAALHWVCTEANLHRADLVVMHARERDISRAEAECVLNLAVNECRERTGVAVRGVLAEVSPAAALISASRDADIVVVGSRGRSGFKTAVFGSVALSVAQGASCPVAVTHPSLKVD
jgi:nucleotide-binding universal stress UspA family protein